MVESFKQRKRKAVVQAYVCSGVMALSAALLVFGGFLILSKLTEKSFPWYGYVLSIAAALLVCGGMLLWTYPTDKRLARKIDEEYALGEKTQTMVEYAGKEGAVLQLQRAQTEEILSALPKRKKSVWEIVKIALFPFLAIVVLVTAIAIPQEKNGAKPSEYLQNDEYDYKYLEALIKNVQASSLTENLKPAYVATLQDLLALIKSPLETGQPLEKSVAKAAVESTMQLVLTLTEADNTYNLFVKAAKEEEGLKGLSQTLKASGNAYERVEGIKLEFYSTLEGKEGALLLSVAQEISAYTDAIVAGGAELEEAEYTAYLTAYQTALGGLLAEEEITALPGLSPSTEENAPTPDGVKVALTGLNATLTQQIEFLNDPESGYPLSAVKTNVATALAALSGNDSRRSASVALHSQAYSVMIQDYTLTTLVDIFGEQLGVQMPEDEEDKKNPDNTQPDNGGGGTGTGGGSAYPNAGEILDPADGTYKPYGEILEERDYFAKVQALLADPNVSQELKDFLKTYFDGLME